MIIQRVVIAGVTSGVGKTLVASAIAYGMQKRGYTVQPFKVGPDYIDPGYLSLAAKREARNLDSWIMGKDRLLESFVSSASEADMSVIEGVMGYYDGMSGTTNKASTYETACILGAPVILVVDASRTARSIAATVIGFTKYQKNARIIGVILNKIGSARHATFCTESIEQLGITVLGSIPRDDVFLLESRHLGLIPPSESPEKRKSVMRVIRTASDYINIDAIIRIAHKAPKLNATVKQSSKARRIKTRICVALDSSFNFYYRDNLDALERHGAKLEFFSPISDSHLPACEALYLGGGFPEVLGSMLAKNSKMKDSIVKYATKDRRAVYAECGGLMYLTRSIQTETSSHKMTGVIDAQTLMTKKMILNYTNAKFVSDSLIAPNAQRIHGHEFHYSCLTDVDSDTSFAYKLDAGVGISDGFDGIMQDNVLASYGHLYFDSADIAKTIVNNAHRIARR